MIVTLVGAGPGDKGLLTLKGLNRIKKADVVLFDRFVGDEILAMIPPCVEKIDVGKNAGNHPVPQNEINRLLLEKARQGLNVVRLKGGDPFVFGRSGEELAFLAENGIPFEVVPGVSSAIAGGAYAGIPITHRDYTSSFHIITGRGKNHEDPNINYDALVRLNGTLVFMMSLAVIDDICQGCITAGMPADMPAAIVENATINLQRKFTGTVESLPAIARRNSVVSPALIIIGKVCALCEPFDWFSRKPLFGKRVLVARAKPGVSELSESLAELGCHVTELPPAKIDALKSPGCDMEKALAKINNYAWLLFTSAVGVNVFFDYMAETKTDIRVLHHLKIACVGAQTEKEINRRLLQAAYRPQEYNGAALAHGLGRLIKPGEKALIARAKDGAQDLTRILSDMNIAFDDAAIYEKKYDTVASSASPIMSPVVAFTSSSAVENFARACGNAVPLKIKAVCIGERSAATARLHGMEAYVSHNATIESMIEKIKELCLHGN
ncbi:MAG: uroporphyrinogen-III C-methyltransferase [Spirochaetes bacterium]|nr:uroporphyrinogen-III C-methyltransferase [Spirochaetota bacterium]